MSDLRRPVNLEESPPDRWRVVVLAAVVALPIVVAAVRAVRHGWLAVGDNGNFLIRSRDVLTSHHPLLGTWSSASIPLGHNVNHPGPLMFDLLTIPAKLGNAGGLAIGVMILHVACVGAIALFGWRAGGLRLAAAALAAAAALSWTMGSELLYDPWQPHTLLLPVLLLLVLVVAMACGDLVALPVAAGVASLIVETHLSYTLLVPPLCLWGVVWLVTARGRDVLRPALAALAVVALCWAQPVADQVHGEGNLGTLVHGLRTKQPTVGAALGVRLTAEVVALPPFFGRSSFATDVLPPKGQGPLIGGRPNIGGLPSSRGAVAGLSVAAAVLAAAWALARRRRDRVAGAAVALSAAALVVALLVTVRLPVGGVGVPPHQVRYLWPLAAFAASTALLGLLPRRWSSGVLAAVAIALAIATLPTHAVAAGPQNDSDAIPIVRELGRHLGTLKREGTLLYDTRQLRFAEPWTSALMAQLQQRGISFTVADSVWARQLGSRRLDHGRASARIFVREGDAARDVPAGVRRVAYVEGLTMAEQRELGTLERTLIDLPVALDAAGRAARATGALPSFKDGTPTAEQLLAFGELAALYNDGLLQIPPDRATDLARYARLRYRWDRHTVGLFLDPKPYG